MRGAPSAFASTQVMQVPLPGRNITKWLDPLPHFAGARVSGTNISVSMHEFQQLVMPQGMYALDALNPPPAGVDPTLGTYVWGYQVGTNPHLYPGFTIEANRGTPTSVTYVNSLPVSGSIVQQYLTLDQSLHWANPDGVAMMVDNPSYPPTLPMMIGNSLVYTGPPPAVVHLHGGEVPSDYDGGPEQWFTSNTTGTGQHGPAYRSATPDLTNSAVYVYPNSQDATTLWFHDHTLGATRLNVYAGLAAFYFLRDWTQECPDLPGGPNDVTVQEPLPGGAKTYKPEIEIVIQDRMFDTNGQWFFPDAPPLNPEHPYWLPEFLGDAIVVNGKTWPYLNVEPRRYRFRFLNGSNARFYRMWLENMVTATPGPPFWQIGSDGGLLDTPVKLDAAAAVPLFLVMAPGERTDIIIDFANFAGQTLTLRNNARAPFPKGATVDPQTVGRIMQFRVGTVVTGNGGVDPSYDPSTLQSPRTSPIVPLSPAAPAVQRQLTLNEVMGMPQTLNNIAYGGGPIEVLVNNTKWAGKDPEGNPIPRSTPDGLGNHLTELPTLGSTEVWDVINLTADAHPIHLHLVQFQLVHRQKFNVNKYTKLYEGKFPGGGIDPMTDQPYPAGVFMPAYGPPGKYDNIDGINAAGALGGNPDITRWLQGPARPPEPNETGWKDTVIMYPGQVTRIVVRWAQQDGGAYFDHFDATSGPGYVWHCHILDHEDNEMMRPYRVVSPIP